MSPGPLFAAEPVRWLGGQAADYGVKLLSNGGLASVHLPSGKQVPHVLATVAEQVANAPVDGVSLLARMAVPLQAFNAVTGVLNLGVGIYNGYQIHQLRQEIPEITGALRAASDERRALHAESMRAAEAIFSQGQWIQQEQQLGFDWINQQFERLRRDHVVEQMIILEESRSLLALKSDKASAERLETTAVGALGAVRTMRGNVQSPLEVLPLTAYAVQALTAQVDANLVLASLSSNPGAYLRTASAVRHRALDLIRAEQAAALSAPFAQNFDSGSGLWLPDAYFAMHQAVIGSGWTGEESRFALGSVAPTRQPHPVLHTLGGGDPDRAAPVSARIWTPEQEPGKLWELRRAVEQPAEPGPAEWVEPIPTIEEAAGQLGLLADETSLDAVLAASEVMSSTSEVLLEAGPETVAVVPALAPLRASTGVLIDPEAVLWAFEESLLRPRQSGDDTGLDDGGPLGLFAGLQVASSDAPTIRAALKDARAYLPQDSATRSDLELLALVNAALTGTVDAADLLNHALSRAGDPLWDFVSLEVYAMSGLAPSSQDVRGLLGALERVGGDLPQTQLGLERLMWAVQDPRAGTIGSWLSRRVALGAAHMAQGGTQPKKAVKAVVGLPDPWGRIFRAAEQVLEKPHDGCSRARARNALEWIDELPADVTELDRTHLKALFDFGR